MRGSLFRIAFRNAALAAEHRQIGNDARASTAWQSAEMKGLRYAQSERAAPASQSSNLQGVRATHSSE